MRLDELKQAMGTIAEDLDSVDRQAYQRAVDDRVSARRRHRVVGVGALAAAAVLAAVVVTPTLMDDANRNAPPAVPVERGNGAVDDPQTVPKVKDPGAVPTIEDGGLTFSTRPAGYRLIGTVVSEPGERSATLTVTPTTTDLSFADVCQLPGVDEARERSSALVSVNGGPLTGRSCGSPRGPFSPTHRFGSSHEANRHAWAEGGVVPGEPVTFTIRFLDDGPSSNRGNTDRVQVGVAVYEDHSKSQQIHGLQVDSLEFVNGYNYRYVDSAFTAVRDRTATVTLERPTGKDDVLVVWGMVDSGTGRVRGMLTGAKPESLSTQGPGDLSAQDLFSAGGPMTWTVRTSPDGGGLAYLLVYKRVD